MKHLKEYLQIARAFSTPATVEAAGSGFSGAQTDRHTELIAAALRDRGLVVGTDVGLSGFKVDIAVTTSDASDRWLVGVLLDGSQWADRPTTIDRDSLPVSVLCNKMSWKRVARVWLPSWRTESESIVDEIMDLVNAAASEPVEVEIAPPAPEPSPELDADLEVPTNEQPADSGPARLASQLSASSDVAEPLVGSATSVPAPAAYPNSRPFIAWSDDSVIGSKDQLDDLRANEAPILAAMRAVIAVEGPIEIERLVKTVARRFDLRKVSAKRLEEISELVPADLITSSDLGEFVWPGDTKPSEWREFRTSESLVRPIPAISPEEITNAAVEVVRSAYSISRSDLIRVVSSQFGAKAVTTPVKERISDALDWAVEARRLSVEDDRFTNA